MTKIIDIIRDEIIKRSNEFEMLTRGTRDEYNIYESHIKYVYKYACLLSQNKEIDYEVLELSALLHDIAMTDINLDRSRHNEYSALIAEDLLRKYNYLEDKIELVKRCILNHSSKRVSFRTTMEEKILVDADSLAHFDSIDQLYSLAHKVFELSDIESLKYIQDKLTRDYNEISDDAKMLVRDRYKRIMSANSINEIL